MRNGNSKERVRITLNRRIPAYSMSQSERQPFLLTGNV